MRNSHKNIYKSYSQRNKSLFGNTEPYINNEDQKVNQYKGEKKFELTVTGYKKGKWKNKIKADNLKQAKNKAKLLYNNTNNFVIAVKEKD